MPERERRQCRRYVVALDVWAEVVSPAGVVDDSAGLMRGTTRNMSDRGLCVAWDRNPMPTALLKCRIFVDGIPVAIPTLAKIRWTDARPGEFLAGLEYLLP